MKKEEVINNIAFVIIVVALLLAVYFKDDLVKVGIILGIGGFLYGLCLAININTTGYIFLALGGSLASSLSLYRYHILDKGDAFTFMICGSVFLLMVVLLIFGRIKNKKIFQVYSLVVEAEVVDLVKNPNTKKEFYQPVYTYTVDDTNYMVNGIGYVDKFIPKLGDKIKLYVNPNDNESVYFDTKLYDKIYSIGLCLFLLVASFVILISLFV